MLKENMKVKGTYKFCSSGEILVYIGYHYSGNGYWHQFTLKGESSIWCELRDTDLCLLEELKE